MSQITFQNLPKTFQTASFDYKKLSKNDEEQALNLLEDLGDLLYTSKISQEKKRKYHTESELDSILS